MSTRDMPEPMGFWNSRQRCDNLCNGNIHYQEIFLKYDKKTKTHLFSYDI